MEWPTVPEVQENFSKLNETALSAVMLPRAVSFATNYIKGKLATCFDTSGWDSDTPPLLYDVHLLLAYGWFAPRVHTGAKLSASDEAAIKAREQAESILKSILQGPPDGMEILDSSGEVIARINRYGTRTVHLRAGAPTFTMAPVEEQELDVIEPTGSAWE